MPIQSSFPRVADQVLTLNKNVVDILTKINQLTTTNDSTVNVQLLDNNGTLRNFSLPTVNSLKSEIERLNNNINSLYSINTTGSLVQTSPNTFKKVFALDLNQEPAGLNSLGPVNSFRATNNWFFDSMINPMISVEFDLVNQIEDNVRSIQVRRYIVEFEKDAIGNLTNNGQSALNSFNTIYRGNSSVSITEFETWHKTTPGVLNGTNPKIDDQIFDLEPNNLLYSGEFNVESIKEDNINRKLWYYVNTLDFVNLSTNSVERLSAGIELLVNVASSSTRYKVVEVSTSESTPKIRLERLEGLDPISVGIGKLKVYSPITSSKKVRISIGYDERNVIFAKPINGDSHIMAKEYSKGTGFWSNDLRLSSNTPDNGTTMERFYTDFVYDYGTVLKDMVTKKIANVQGATPTAPALDVTRFKVEQINKHLTDTPDANLIKQKNNYVQTLKSEILQISQTITDLNKKSKTQKQASDGTKKQIQLEIDELTRRKDSKSKLLSSTTQEIIDLSKNPNSKASPKFAVRGFIPVPDAAIAKGTRAQEIVQFKIYYKYLSKDGRESGTTTYQVDNATTGAYSNWVEIKTQPRKQIFDPKTGLYSWEIEDVANANVPNFNQLEIPIQANEKVEIKIKSISEVGFPESPIESDWSNTITVDFPDDLVNVLNENETIKSEAAKEDLKGSVNSELAAKGLDKHLSDTFDDAGKTFFHEAKNIYSGFRDENNNFMSILDYMQKLQDRIKALEEKITRVKGELKVFLVQNTLNASSKETEIQRGTITQVEISCENYLEAYQDTNVQASRTYINKIYKIDDFAVVIRNVAADSPLGLLSSRNYATNNSDVYNPSAPQVFWVNSNDELLTSDETGRTYTQINNQFIWAVNYDSVVTSNVGALSQDIGNSFISDKTNSVTNVLGTKDYNLGYAQTGILKFNNNNKSLTSDPTKWTDRSDSGASSGDRLLSTIHPVVPSLSQIVENNQDKVSTLAAGKEIRIPIWVYFKMNGLDITQTGSGFNYISLNELQTTQVHEKKIKFWMQSEDGRSFDFTLKFKLNRNVSSGSGRRRATYNPPFPIRK